MRWVVLLCVVLGVGAGAETAFAAPTTRFSDGTSVTAVGSVSPGRVPRGGMVVLNATFTSLVRVDAVNLSLEVHDSAGVLILKHLAEGQSLDAGQGRSF